MPQSEKELSNKSVEVKDKERSRPQAFGEKSETCQISAWVVPRSGRPFCREVRAAEDLPSIFEEFPRTCGCLQSG